MNLREITSGLKECLKTIDLRQKEKRAAEDEMVRWYHRLNGHEFEQSLGDSERQGSLVCCNLSDHN